MAPTWAGPGLLRTLQDISEREDEMIPRQHRYGELRTV